MVTVCPEQLPTQLQFCLIAAAVISLTRFRVSGLVRRFLPVRDSAGLRNAETDKGVSCHGLWINSKAINTAAKTNKPHAV
jgi:hypothetical protein